MNKRTGLVKIIALLIIALIAYAAVKLNFISGIQADSLNIETADNLFARIQRLYETHLQEQLITYGLSPATELFRLISEYAIDPMKSTLQSVLAGGSAKS